MYYLQLARTCYNFYQSTPTKLAGENYFLHSGQLMFKSLFVIYTRWTTTNFLTWRICFLHDILNKLSLKSNVIIGLIVRDCILCDGLYFLYMIICMTLNFMQWIVFFVYDILFSIMRH
uniref:Uncharacterized protein n=1 Tax=Lactuca sativa TaxID=4236 RepID=A0A9R1XJP7_LACSA|nr:hypothetical protein LSAT_V11C300135130 [Lactuca sativa]